MAREGCEEDEPFRVYAENWLTLSIFWATWHQWRTAVINNTVLRTGIDWAQVESVLAMKRIKHKHWPMIFEGLQAIQNDYLDLKKS